MCVRVVEAEGFLCFPFGFASFAWLRHDLFNHNAFLSVDENEMSAFLRWITWQFRQGATLRMNLAEKVCPPRRDSSNLFVSESETKVRDSAQMRGTYCAGVLCEHSAGIARGRWFPFGEA